MDYSLVHAVWTLLLLVIFIGIIVWAWSGRRKRRFEEAARLPLDDDARPNGGRPASGERDDG